MFNGESGKFYKDYLINNYNVNRKRHRFIRHSPVSFSLFATKGLNIYKRGMRKTEQNTYFRFLSIIDKLRLYTLSIIRVLRHIDTV
jgi:hypothetical protein